MLFLKREASTCDF